MDDLQSPTGSLLQLHGGKCGVVPADRDQPCDAEPRQRGQHIVELLRTFRRVCASRTQIRPASKVNPTDILDRERPYLSCAAFHEPFEPIDDSQDVRPPKNTADRRCADHTIDSWSRPASDKNPHCWVLHRHLFLPPAVFMTPLNLFKICGMVVYSIHSRWQALRPLSPLNDSYG